MLQATQLDSERQPNSNSGVTPNCHRAAPRKSREQLGTRTKPNPPRPAHACALPPSSPFARVVGQNPRGPGLV